MHNRRRKPSAASAADWRPDGFRRTSVSTSNVERPTLNVHLGSQRLCSWMLNLGRFFSQRELRPDRRMIGWFRPLAHFAIDPSAGASISELSPDENHVDTQPAVLRE